MNSEALQHIESTLPASSLAFAVAVWPTVAGYFVPHWPHDIQALAQHPESLSGLDISAGIYLALRRHRAPCWHDAYRRLQR